MLRNPMEEDASSSSSKGTSSLPSPCRSPANPLPVTPLSELSESIDEEESCDATYTPFRFQSLYGAADICIDEDDDPTTKLLRDGLEHVLQTVVNGTGAHSHPSVFVTFKDLNFHCRTFKGSNMIATYGNRIAHALTFWRRYQTQQRDVLKDVSGSFRAGKLTLLLGPPQSGKSALMKAIAGRLGQGRHAHLHGTILYAGRDLQSKEGQESHMVLPKLVGYIPQVDAHFGPLTVEETVEFAHQCTSRVEEKHLEKGLADVTQRKWLMDFDSLYSEVIMELLGIRHIKKAPAAAISTGQRKRLTTAEILIMRTPVLFGDEISTGLDSATTFEICKTLRISAQARNRTIVVSLTHLTQEVFELFDEVTVMCAGQIAFQGPRDEAVPYFESLGFQCPTGKSAAAFLREVTLAEGMRRTRRKCSHATGSPIIQTLEDFGVAWRNSSQLERRIEEDQALQKQSAAELDALPLDGYCHHRLTHTYTPSFWRTVWLCLDRQIKLTRRNKRMLRARFVVVIACAFLLGTLYLNLKSDAFSLRSAVIFYTLLNMMMAYGAIPVFFASRPTLYGQMAAKFYHPMAYTIAVHLLDIPLSFLETLIYCSLVYWSCGMAPDPACFGIFVAIGFCVRIGMTAFFRVITMLCPNDVTAMGATTFWVVVFVECCGYLITEANMPYWWIWAYWGNPVQYAMTMMSLLEFHSAAYATPKFENGTYVGTVGDYYLENRGVTTNDIRLYPCFAFLVGWWIVMVVLHSVILQYIRWPDRFPPPPAHPAEITEDRPQAQLIPFTPCTLAWEDVHFETLGPKKWCRRRPGRRLLHPLSGFATPGTMTAIMGRSGAGKTHFLDVLAGLKTVGHVHGRILLNGQLLPPSAFRRFAALVDQRPALSASATVMEALQFSAQLRLPRETSAHDRKAHVLQVISMLDLEGLVNCPLGNGLTAEQIKRVCIGIELVTNPAVLLLDEPTTGLDPIAAERVLSALEAVRDTGRTVICTLHQPCPNIFASFDRLILLKSGHLVFFGNISDVVLYFSCIPGVVPHDGAQNPATWVMSAMSAAGVNVAELYASSSLAEDNQKMMASMLEPTGEPLVVRHKYQASTMVQLLAVTQKWMRIHWRSPDYNMARTLSIIFIALALGTLVWQVPINDPASLMSILGAQFILFVFVGFLYCIQPQGILARERAVFYRDQANQMYHPLIFNFVTAAWEVPYVAFNSLVATFILYWFMGLIPSVSAFFFWYFLLCLILLLCTFYGVLMAWLIPTPDISIAMIGMSLVMFELVTGLSLPRKSIPWYWRWMHFIVPLPYVFQAAASSQLYCSPTPDKPCPEMVTGNIGEHVTMSVWEFAEMRFDLVYEDRWMYAGILIASIALIHIASGLALLFVNHEKR